MKQPDFANGKICYVEIPTADSVASSEFYKNCFGWIIRNDNAGNISFDDTVGQVSGMWVPGRPAAIDAGFLISIMVEDIAQTAKMIVGQGGSIVNSNLEGNEKAAWFKDPYGNLWGLYQHNF